MVIQSLGVPGGLPPQIALQLLHGSDYPSDPASGRLLGMRFLVFPQFPYDILQLREDLILLLDGLLEITGSFPQVHDHLRVRLKVDTIFCDAGGQTT